MKINLPHRHDNEVWGTSEWIALHKDAQGIVRAWAIGSSKDKAARAALIELGKYREKKRAVGDPLGNAKFTCAILPYCDKCASPVFS